MPNRRTGRRRSVAPRRERAHRLDRFVVARLDCGRCARLSRAPRQIPRTAGLGRALEYQHGPSARTRPPRHVRPHARRSAHPARGRGTVDRGHALGHCARVGSGVRVRSQQRCARVRASRRSVRGARAFGCRGDQGAVRPRRRPPPCNRLRASGPRARTLRTPTFSRRTSPSKSRRRALSSSAAASCSPPRTCLGDFSTSSPTSRRRVSATTSPCAWQTSSVRSPRAAGSMEIRWRR